MSAALIAKLIEAGTPADLVAEVAMELSRAQVVTETLDRRRKNERERKARSREVTGQSVTARDGADKGSLEVSPRTPLPKPSKSSPLNPPKSKLVDQPAWMPSEEWASFKEMRHKMRGIPFTEAAERTVIAKLARLRADGHDPAKLLSKAVERGHRTVFEDETTKSVAGKSVPLTAQQLRERAEWFIRHGQQDRADECRQKAVKLEQRSIA